MNPGSVAVVTGGAKGIGKAISAALLRSKTKVNILDINVKEGEKVQNEFNKEHGEGMATFTKCDVTNEEEFEGAISLAVKQHGRFDLLCNNAGVLELTTDLKRVIDINLTSTIRGTLIGLRYMDTSRGGHGGNIINIASLAGLFYVNIPGSPGIYAASKHGVVGFTRTLAQAAIHVGVRLNCICPSFTETDLAAKSLELFPDIKPMLEALGIRSPMPVDVVGEAFMELLRDGNKHGEAMRISIQNGIDYHPFSEEQAPI